MTVMGQDPLVPYSSGSSGLQEVHSEPAFLIESCLIQVFSLSFFLLFQPQGFHAST